jgi:hypothetical protein
MLALLDHARTAGSTSRLAHVGMADLSLTCWRRLADPKEPTLALWKTSVGWVGVL